MKIIQKEAGVGPLKNAYIYDSRLVNYDRRGFITFATGHAVVNLINNLCS